MTVVNIFLPFLDTLATSSLTPWTDAKRLQLPPPPAADHAFRIAPETHPFGGVERPGFFEPTRSGQRT